MASLTDPERIAALQATGLLDSPPEKAFDRIVHLARRILKMPVCIVSLVEVDRQFFISCAGLPEPWATNREMPISHSFCRHVVDSAVPVLITDAREDPRVRENPAIGELNVLAYLGVPLLTPNGNVIGSFCVFNTQPHEWTQEEVAIMSDLAASVMSEIALRHATIQERKLLRTVIDNIPDPIFTKDKERRFVMSNAAHLLLRGKCSEQEIAGKTVFDLHPPELAEAYDRDDRRVLEQGEVVTNREEIVEDANGGRHVHLTTKVPIRSGEGEVIGLVAISRNIDERKRAERELAASRARFAGIVESAMDAIISVTVDQRVVLFNRAAEAMFGCPATEAMGSTLDRFIPSRFRDSHRQQVRGFGESGVTSRTLGSLGKPLAALRANGEEFPVEASISKIEVGGEQLFTVILRDATERVAAERSIRQLNEELELRVRERTVQLEEANRELESFCYSVSHDLRAPLRAIDGFTRILTEDYAVHFDAEGHRLAKVISGETRRMGVLIDELLEFSRLGRQSLSRTDIDMNALAREVIVEALVGAEGRAIDFTIDDLPPAFGDPSLMRQVLVNLFSNSVKFTRRRDRATVHVGGRRGNGRVVYWVRDNGAGFDPEYKDRLFRVFQRLHRQEEFEGTGVGLAFVHRILHRHGGSIWAEGVEGEGATFSFALPLPDSPRNI